MNDGSENPEIVSRFEKLDFSSLWKGRERVDYLEKIVLSSFLSRSDCSRVLELGTGNGRLTDIVQNYAKQYVACDINKSFLMQVKRKVLLKDAIFVASNLYHLPFAEESFSCIVMIRVFNFVSQPIHVFRKISNILAPGGFLLISINPKPSVATLVDDIKYHVINNEAKLSKAKSVTFSRSKISEVHPASSPTFAFKRKFIEELFSMNNLSQRMKISTGIEDYSLIERLPTKFFLKVGTLFNFFPLFPTNFFLLQKKNHHAGRLPDIHQILKCPKCGSKITMNGEPTVHTCRICSSVYTMDQGILDMIHIPVGAKIADEGEWVLGRRNLGGGK
jgi:ubiquinone/menaquinone biosynthesis C-methylase UbiE